VSATFIVESFNELYVWPPKPGAVVAFARALRRRLWRHARTSNAVIMRARTATAAIMPIFLAKDDDIDEVEPTPSRIVDALDSVMLGVEVEELDP